MNSVIKDITTKIRKDMNQTLQLRRVWKKQKRKNLRNELNVT